MRTIYLDYNATTPLDPEVSQAMLPFLTDIWGNPSSVHHLGRLARSLLDDARDRVAGIFRCKPSEVLFTSGGTESANTAILGVARQRRAHGRHLVTSAVEHHAVLHACDYLARTEGFTITRLPVDSAGAVSPDDLKRALRPDTTLVSIMAANNEIGTLQPIAELGDICRQSGVPFHTDAAQWFGKEAFAHIDQFNADLVSVCAHKIYGPKGAGALFIRSPLRPDPVLFGGGHENERRAGTENLAAIAGLVAALERFVRPPVFSREKIAPLSNRLLALIDGLDGARFVGSRSNRLSNTVAFVVAGADSSSLLAGLDMEGICASSGSACSSGSLEPSHVVLALGLSRELASALVRFSLGRDSSMNDVETVEQTLPLIVRRSRSPGTR